MPLPALSFAPYIIENALATKLIFPYYTINSWHIKSPPQASDEVKISFLNSPQLS